MTFEQEIIVAPATPSGGALGVIRISGKGSIALVEPLFRGRRALQEAATHTLHFGALYDGEELIDEVLLSLFRAPHSYTGEEAVEISCHGSRYVMERLLQLIIRSGARAAEAGEFSMRAYLNGRLDLAQAEAVADLIASESQASHRLAMNQMRGHYSERLAELSNRLLKLCALVELELDFSEEDVEFADRGELGQQIRTLHEEVLRLEKSYRLGNVLKQGVSVAIVGAPNAGKSTLLNRLVGENRALVSEIAGTTRDTIEERIQLDGITFRFIDTAGLHESHDRLEQMGMERTREAMQRAQIVLHLVDAQEPRFSHPALTEEQHYLLVFNKIDRLAEAEREALARHEEAPILISAKRELGLQELESALVGCIDRTALKQGDTIVSNARHFEALQEANQALQRALDALEKQLPTDLLSEELRQVIHHLGSITGNEITSDRILQSIFSSFCIGK